MDPYAPQHRNSGLDHDDELGYSSPSDGELEVPLDPKDRHLLRLRRGGDRPSNKPYNMEYLYGFIGAAARLQAMQQALGHYQLVAHIGVDNPQQLRLLRKKLLHYSGSDALGAHPLARRREAYDLERGWAPDQLKRGQDPVQPPKPNLVFSGLSPDRDEPTKQLFTELVPLAKYTTNKQCPPPYAAARFSSPSLPGRQVLQTFSAPAFLVMFVHKITLSNTVTDPGARDNFLAIRILVLAHAEAIGFNPSSEGLGLTCAAVRLAADQLLKGPAWQLLHALLDSKETRQYWLDLGRAAAKLEVDARRRGDQGWQASSREKAEVEVLTSIYWDVFRWTRSLFLDPNPSEATTDRLFKALARFQEHFPQPSSRSQFQQSAPSPVSCTVM
ncbi:hypothetical protein JCM11641_008066 [Rhodosporidiobolus odoratus]